MAVRVGSVPCTSESVIILVTISAAIVIDAPLDSSTPSKQGLCKKAFISSNWKCQPANGLSEAQMMLDVLTTSIWPTFFNFQSDAGEGSVGCCKN